MDDFDSLYKIATPVPHATETGRQEGVIPPAQRRPKPGTYKVVDNKEAVANMIARKSGEMELIAGGTDDNRVLESTFSKKAELSNQSQKVVSNQENFDLTDDDNTEEKTSSLDVLQDIAKALRGLNLDGGAASKYNRGFQGQNIANPYNENVHPEKHLDTKTVTMEIRQEHQDGTFTSIMTVGLPVSHVIQTSSSVTLITPITNNQYTFQPTAGSDILLNGAGLTNIHVFYPGTSFVLDDYKISGMCFVKAK